MPQASDVDRYRYERRFGTIDAGPGLSWLESRGYTITPDFYILGPDRLPTKIELDVVDFLRNEWDYGDLVSQYRNDI